MKIQTYERECHDYEKRFTGRAIPALPGQELVTVVLDVGSDRFWVRRSLIQAWGTYREVLVVDREPVRVCRCGEKASSPPYFELRPMVADADVDGVLADYVSHGNPDNVAPVGVYAMGVEPTDEDIQRAVGEARDKVA